MMKGIKSISLQMPSCYQPNSGWNTGNCWWCPRFTPLWFDFTFYHEPTDFNKDFYILLCYRK